MSNLKANGFTVPGLQAHELAGEESHFQYDLSSEKRLKVRGTNTLFFTSPYSQSGSCASELSGR